MNIAGAPDLTFLAPNGAVADWRMVVLVDAAAGTGLLDALPGTPEDLAARTGLQHDAVRRVLEALVTVEVCTERDGVYHAEPLPAEDLAVLRHHAHMIGRWSHGLEPALRGEGPPGGSLPHDLDVFLPALAGRARRRAVTVVQQCRELLPAATRVLDLGGGHGEDALAFARAGFDVAIQDLPPVIEWVRRRGELEEAGVHLVTGDLTEVLADGPFDLVLLAGLTHIFPPAEVSELFLRLHDRVSADGGLAISTRLRGQSPTSALFSVQMLLVGRGGDTHSRQEYDEWLARAGFPRTVEVPVATDGLGDTKVLFALQR